MISLALISPWFFFYSIFDIAGYWLVWSLSLLLFIHHGTNKEPVPVHSTEDSFMSDTKWDRDCCAATVSELPMAWTMCEPHQVQRKEMISWYKLDYTLLFTLTFTNDDALLFCIFPATELWWDLCTEWPTGKSLLWNGDAVRDSMGKTAERVREIISHQSQVHWSITEAFECLCEKIIVSCWITFISCAKKIITLSQWFFGWTLLICVSKQPHWNHPETTQASSKSFARANTTYTWLGVS